MKIATGFKLLIAVIISFSFICQNEQRETTYILAFAEKVRFLNEIKTAFTKIDIRRYKNIYFSDYKVHFVSTLPDKLKKIKGDLKEGDFDYFISQMNEYGKLEEKDSAVDFKIKGANIISKFEFNNFGKTYTEFWRNYKKKYSEISLLILSKPLISKDFKLLLIEIQVISDTKEKSSQILYAFKKVNNIWTLCSEL